MSLRVRRISEEIKKEISKIISKGLRIEINGLITIKDVDISPDLKYAKVYFSFFMLKKKSLNIQYLLSSQIGYFKKKLAKKLKLRCIPNIIFIYDDTLSNVEKMNKLFNKL